MAKTVYKCNIATELLDAWKKLTRKKDSVAICELYGFSRPTIDKALLHGQVDTPEVKDKINEFFKKRLERERAEAEELKSLNNS